ncbi:MAG TPA: MerR family transcriptional regulator [Solirubrobacteraceae bacterium]|jgi:MerR family transcriptional regulator/heat shock protein HspR|nr:MerR family transcriptional regulator [Solirubrobacteraceae bacterium]
MSEPATPGGDGAAGAGERVPLTRRTRIEVALDRGVFMISVAAELAEMHPQTLRMYEARGLIEPSRSPKGTRLYSQADVERLRRIQQMTAELGLNLAGVERVLALEAELEELHARLLATAAQAESARADMEHELERVRRSMSAEIVRYSAATTAIVRAADARAPFGARPGAPRER